jgi:hypothetical protein
VVDEDFVVDKMQSIAAFAPIIRRLRQCVSILIAEAPQRRNGAPNMGIFQQLPVGSSANSR